MITNSRQRTAFDASWLGTSGIGRFATETLARRPEWVPINRTARATSPTAPIRLGSAARHTPNLQLLISPGYIPPLGCALPYAVTLHDLMYVRGGANHQPARAAYFKMIRRRLMSSNCVVLTVSEYSRRQILEWTEGRVLVRVVGNGVSPVPTVDPPPTPDATRPTVLIVASERPNKNLHRQLRAADLALRHVGGRINVVLPAAPTAELLKVIRSLGSEVHLHVKVSDDDLWRCYRSADLLVTASLEEGFGLPALEAMAARCPIVYSEVGGMTEVVAGCGIAVDPLDEKSIAAGIATGLEREVRLEQLVQSAYERSQDFSWDRVVERIDDAVADLLQ